MALVYNGLIRQFRITLLAIMVCAIDLVSNTIWMDYNMLWLFMIDCCAVVILNFIAFRDSQYFIMHLFQISAKFGCESCTYLIDVCCCMKDSTFDVKHDDDETTATTTTSTNQENGEEDSFLRYDQGQQIEVGVNNQIGAETDITAISG